MILLLQDYNTHTGKHQSPYMRMLHLVVNECIIFIVYACNVYSVPDLYSLFLLSSFALDPPWMHFADFNR